MDSIRPRESRLKLFFCCYKTFVYSFILEKPFLLSITNSVEDYQESHTLLYQSQYVVNILQNFIKGAEGFLSSVVFFIYFFYLYINISYKNLLVGVNPQATSVEIGFTTNPSPVTDNVTVVEIVANVSKVSTVSIMMIFFRFKTFVFKLPSHFLRLLKE